MLTRCSALMNVRRKRGNALKICHRSLLTFQSYQSCPSQTKWHFISDLLVIIIWLAICNQIYNKDIPILRRNDNAPFNNFSVAGNLKNE